MGSLDTEKVYYMKLPTEARPYNAAGVLPVVERTLGDDFSRLKEVLCMKINAANQLYILPIEIYPPANRFDSVLNTEPIEDRETVLAIASRLCEYCHGNEKNLKLIALCQAPGSPEESFLKKAAGFVNDELQQESSEQLRKIDLEELAAL